MKSIIVGGGKVGFALAANLCKEGHDVTVIDSDRSRLDLMEEHLNISTVHGNAARLETLAAADAAASDLIIAVTDKDELNLVTCFLAHRAGVKSAVARVRAPGYSDLNNSDALSALGIDMLINPEKVTAQEIGKLIAYPEANHVSYFGGGQIVMMELHLPADCARLNIPLHQMKCPVPCIIMGIEHEGQLIIPRGNDRLSAGEDVLLLTAVKDVRQVEDYMGIAHLRPTDIVILGGGLAGYYLAELLDRSDHHYNVKIFEPDRAQAEEMASQLKHTTVINCSSEAAISMFEDENVGSSDLLIAVSEDDKVNLFACVAANDPGRIRLPDRAGRRGNGGQPQPAHPQYYPHFHQPQPGAVPDPLRGLPRPDHRIPDHPRRTGGRTEDQGYPDAAVHPDLHDHPRGPAPDPQRRGSDPARGFAHHLFAARSPAAAGAPAEREQGAALPGGLICVPDVSFTCWAGCWWSSASPCSCPWPWP